MNEREGVTSAGVFADLEIIETLSYTTEDPAADIYAMRPNRTPLSVRESHAELKLSTGDGSITVELDGEELDSLIDSLYRIQQFHFEGE